jgi:uncharacterized membrane protein
MRSRAAIGSHPIHPALVTVPVGALVVAAVADVGYLATSRVFWAEMAAASLVVGLVGALLAALPGLIDYTALPEDAPVRSIATTHMLLNFTVVGLQSLSLFLRCRVEVPLFAPSASALALSFVAFALLLASGWLGGRMVFEHGAGVAVVPGPPTGRP